jgi:hypothetical protein
MCTAAFKVGEVSNCSYKEWSQFYVLILKLITKVNIKDTLKARIVQILFSQTGNNCVRCTVETFTLDRLAIAYQIKSMV